MLQLLLLLLQLRRQQWAAAAADILLLLLRYQAAPAGSAQSREDGEGPLLVGVSRKLRGTHRI